MFSCNVNFPSQGHIPKLNVYHKLSGNPLDLASLNRFSYIFGYENAGFDCKTFVHAL